MNAKARLNLASPPPRVKVIPKKLENIPRHRYNFHPTSVQNRLLNPNAGKFCSSISCLKDKGRLSKNV